MALAAIRRFFTQETELPHGWLDEYREEFKYTPDIRTLQMGRSWLVFEYGEFMLGKKEHQDFVDTGGIERIGHAFTKSSNLVMYKKELGEFSYPFVLAHMPKNPKMQYRLDGNTQPARIKGDLFLVNGAEAISLLDRVRENGVAFKRVRMEVLFPFVKSVWDGQKGSFVSEEYLETVPAWTYIGVKNYWDGFDVIEEKTAPVRKWVSSEDGRATELKLVDGPSSYREAARLDLGYSTKLVHRFPHINNRREYAEYPMGDYYYYSALEDDK